MTKRSNAAPSSAAKDQAVAERKVYGRSEEEVLNEEIHLRIFKTQQSPFWYVQFPHPTKRQYKKSLNTKNKKEAVRRAWKELNDFQEGRSAASKAGPKVEDAVEKFLAEKKRLACASSSIGEYRRTLTQFCLFCKEVGVARLGTLTASIMSEFEERLKTRGIAIPKACATRGRPAKLNLPTTVHEKVKLVKGLTKFAVDFGLISSNPISSYKLPRDGKPNNYCYTVEEVQAVSANADEFFGDVFTFLACTGLRQSELRWATKEDVDLERRLLHIRAKKFPKAGLSWSPKGDDRIVPLGKQALEIATKMLAADAKSRWLFPAPPAPNVRDDQLRPCRLEIQLRRAKLAAGVEKGTLHSFRHFFVSTMANSNTSPFKVMKIVGHKSLDIILTYYHVQGEELLAAVDEVDFATLLRTKSDQE